MKLKNRFLGAMLCMALMLIAVPLRAEDEESALAKKTQNPVADLISVPFQNNTNYGYGPHHNVQNMFNIQPVIPIN